MTLLELRGSATRKPADVGGDMPAFPQPVSSVFADLLPDEILAKRRLGYLKRRMVFGLVALALVIGLGDALARQQTNAASGQLSSARSRISTLNAQVNRFRGVVGVQTETQQIDALLSQAMAGDVPWATLIARLERLAPRGVTLSEVDAGPDDSGRTPSTSAAGPTTVGSLTLSGSATSYRAVADYVAALSAVHGLTSVNPATASSAGSVHGGLTFTITAALTTAVQGGPYATTHPTAGSTASRSGPPASAPTAASAPTSTARDVAARPRPSSPARGTPAAAAPSTAPAPVGN